MSRFLLMGFVVTLLLVACSQQQPRNPNNDPPTVRLEVSTGDAKRGILAVANASDPNGDALNYQWTFGDGTSLSGSSTMSYSYSASGTYTVTVTVSDGQDTASARQTVKVRHLRPADTPDVVVIGFAGRCGFSGFGCWNPPDGNVAYLDDPETQTIQAVIDAFSSLGHRVAYVNSRAHMYSLQLAPDAIEPGFLQTENELAYVSEYWISDFDNPTRLVLVGHSHGTLWASLLAWNHPELGFDYFIYLDGICSYWWGDNERYVVAAYDAYGLRRPFPLNNDEYGQPCDALYVPGLSSGQDIEDVVPDNVAVALEVQASSLSIPHDIAPNHRWNGYRNGILTLQSVDFHFGASGIHVRGREAMNWVVQAINYLGLPASGQFSTSSIHEIKEVVPAPEGFRYYEGR